MPDGIGITYEPRGIFLDPSLLYARLDEVQRVIRHEVRHWQQWRQHPAMNDDEADQYAGRHHSEKLARQIRTARSSASERTRGPWARLFATPVERPGSRERVLARLLRASARNPSGLTTVPVALRV